MLHFQKQFLEKQKMRLHSLKLWCVPTSPVRAVVGSPVVRKDNKIDISPTLLTGSRGRKHLKPVELPVKTCQLGSYLGDTVEQEVEAEEVSQDAAPALPRNRGSINDNYCLTSQVPVARSVKDVVNVKRQNSSVSVQQPVLCPVVSPVPSVLNVRGQSQKKDASPSSEMKPEINFVKSVFTVDYSVSAPNVLSAHNTANVQHVGGHLQEFWQKWSLLGANPRVVSIL